MYLTKTLKKLKIKSFVLGLVCDKAQNEKGMGVNVKTHGCDNDLLKFNSIGI